MAKDLAKEIPGTMSAFGRLHAAAASEGKLTAKCKELIALAIAVACRCDGCISYHVHDALQAGAAKDEIAEAIGVAVLMGGGPAMLYGAEALNAVDQFESQALLAAR